MLKIHQLCLVSILTTSLSVKSEKYSLQIEGVSGLLKKNVQAQLSTIQKDEITKDRYFYSRIEDAIREGLKALGYYEPKIDFESCFSLEKKHVVVRIFPGKPVRISGINIVLRGEAQTDQDFLYLLDKHPTIGAVLNHGCYDEFKKLLVGVALRKGYFDGYFNKSQLGISLEKHQAFWNIDYDSGQRFCFGTVTFEGSQIRDKYLQNLIPFKERDYFDSKDLAELNRRLSATGWFSSVVIAPEFEKSDKYKVLPLRGIISPRIQNSVETGIGYSTDVGVRMKVLWKKPWINSCGHSLTASSSISTPEQQIDFSYKVPLQKNPLEQYYLVQGEFKRTELDKDETDSTAITISRYWDFTNKWQKAINLRWNLNHFTQANDSSSSTMLFCSGVMVNRTRSRGGLMPIWGDSQRYSVDFSTTLWGSDVDFIVTQARNVWIRTIYDHHRFVIRSHLGWIETCDFDRLAPNLRFFAGGDRSVRGYRYKSISQKNNEGKLIGASKLITSSLEYQYNVTGKWWSSMFIDTGNASNNMLYNDFKTSAGIGICWQSLIGPIKIDFAIPINDKEKHDLQFYIGLGPEL